MRFLLNFVLGIFKMLFLQLLSLVIILYIIGSFIYFEAVVKSDIQYESTNGVEYFGTVLTQPAVDVFGNGKVGREWNRKGYNKIDLKENIELKNFGEYKEQVARYSSFDDNPYFTKNANTVSFGAVDYDGKWALLACSIEADEPCSRYVIYSSRPKAIIINVDEVESYNFLGISIDGKEIQLEAFGVKEVKDLSNDVILL